MEYLIKPNKNGEREDTKLAVEFTDEQISEMLKNGYFLVSDDDFQKLIGNADKPYSIAMDGTLYETPPYEPTVEELQAQALAQAKAERAEAVSRITVEVDGMVFDGDEPAQGRIGRTVAAALALGVDINTEKRAWVLADNTIAQPTIAQLAEALRLAGDKMTELWIVPYQAE